LEKLGKVLEVQAVGTKGFRKATWAVQDGMDIRARCIEQVGQSGLTKEKRLKILLL